MKAIETVWKGYRFRSRTEARWAVFLDRLGAEFEYEPEGVELPSGRYLPDFSITLFDWSGDLDLDTFRTIPGTERIERSRIWLEVKGQAPSEDEALRCAELAVASGDRVLLAVGAPKTEPQIMRFDPVSPDYVDDGLTREQSSMRRAAARSYHLAQCSWRGGLCIDSPVTWFEDPEFPGQLMPDGGQRWLGCHRPPKPYPAFPGDWRPVFGPDMRAAYDAARSARFEFGQTDDRWAP